MFELKKKKDGNKGGKKARAEVGSLPWGRGTKSGLDPTAGAGQRDTETYYCWAFIFVNETRFC